MKRLAAAASVLAVLTFASTAAAGTTYTYIGVVPSANWTDSTKWTPPSSYPGAQSGDSAFVTTSTSTINVDAAIPNPVTLSMICTGCTLNLPAGGVLGVEGSSNVGDGTAVTVNGGTLSIASGTLAFGSSSQTVALNSGTLAVQSGASVTNAVTGGTGGTLSVDGTLAFRAGSTAPALGGAGTMSMPNAGTLTAGGADTDTTFSGVYQDGSGGAAKLTKTGTGTLTLAGTNTYTGATDIQNGGLTVSGTVAGAVTVENGATLTCSGTISGLVTVQPGGDLVDNGCSFDGGVMQDGRGGIFYNGFPIANGSGDNGLEFDFSLDNDEVFQNGALEITVPSGWSPPSTNSADPGYTTSDCGTVSAAGMVITVTGITETGPMTCEVFYGDLPGPGVTAPTTPGPYSFDARTKAFAGGSFAAMGSPQVDVLAPDGSGTMVSDTLSVAAGSSGNTVEFTYTAAFGGIFGGALAINVPLGWSTPSDNPSDPGYITTSDGGPFTLVDGRTFYVFLVVLDEGEQIHFQYGGTSGGATAPGTPGKYGFRSSSQASCDCNSQLQRLAASPVIRVRPADGTGTANVSPTQASAGSLTTFTLKYKPDAGGMENGEVQVDAPVGWTAPQTANPAAPGYVTSTAGTVSTNGQEIHVSGLTLFGDIARIQYRPVVGPSTGLKTLTVSQKGSPGGTLTPISSSPQVTVYPADGSGTMSTPTASVTHGSTGNRITFTYTAAAGGMSNGTVGLKIPVGWNLPSTNNAQPGFTTATTGTVTISGQTILVTGVTLSGGGTMSITYGASPSPGATAPSTIGPKTFPAYSRTTNAGVTTQLAASPVIATT